MTIGKYFPRIICDTCQAAASAPQDNPDAAAMAARDAEYLAYGDGKHICPKCLETQEEQRRAALERIEAEHSFEVCEAA